MSTSKTAATLVLIKPDAIRRRLAGRIISRIEACGFVLLALRIADECEMVEEHYREHKHAAYFYDLLRSMRGPLIAAVVRHSEVPAETVTLMRALVGPYRDRVAGTLRGDFAENDRENSIHASSDEHEARRETSLWFPDEIFEDPSDAVHRVSESTNLEHPRQSGRLANPTARRT